MENKIKVRLESDKKIDDTEEGEVKTGHEKSKEKI